MIFSSPLRRGVEFQFLEDAHSLGVTDYHKLPAVAMPNLNVPSAHSCSSRRSAPNRERLLAGDVASRVLAHLGLLACGEAFSVAGPLLGGRDADRGVGVDQELPGH